MYVAIEPDVDHLLEIVGSHVDTALYLFVNEDEAVPCYWVYLAAMASILEELYGS